MMSHLQTNVKNGNLIYYIIYLNLLYNLLYNLILIYII